MRKELLGPLPIAVGILLVVSAFVFAPRPPPPPCACPVYTPAEFENLDLAGYPGVASGATLLVDGRVAEVRPPELIGSPYRLVRLDGSSFVYNVTDYDPHTGPVGEWSRLAATHAGESEQGGPDTGHRWTHLGKTAPPGGSAVSLAGLALGLSVLAWGAATYGRFGESRALEAALRSRLRADRAALEADPAARAAKALRASIAEAASLVRRGQLDAARSTLDGVEAQLARAARLGERIAAAKQGAAAESARGFNGKAVAAALDEAEKERLAGNVPGSEALVDWAEHNLKEIPRVRELLLIAGASMQANRAAGAQDEAAEAAVSEAQAKFDEGMADEAADAAALAVDRLRESSPGAHAARADIAALDEAVRLHPSADRAREVRDRMRDAAAAYHLGQFERARAEARVGLWLVDPESLSHGRFQALVESHHARQGFARLKGEPRGPSVGFVVAKGGERVLLVTSPWREFPSERVLLAVKDALDAGAADRGVVYSSVFANTSTNDRIEVVEVKQLVELLLRAAIDEVAAGA